MNKENTRYLKEMVLAQEFSNEKEEEIRHLICAFSEYMVASNPEYLYNKTYLEAFVDGFIKSKKQLKLKYDILMNELVKITLASGIETDKLKISVDNAWIFDCNQIKLLNSFNEKQVCSSKIRYDIEYLGEKGFAVANEVNLATKYKDIIKGDVLLFIKKFEEVKKDVKKNVVNAESDK